MKKAVIIIAIVLVLVAGGVVAYANFHPSPAPTDYSADITISGEHVGEIKIPTNVTVEHDATDWEYLGKDVHRHSRGCTECEYHEEHDCTYNSWSTVSSEHHRNCQACTGLDNHAPNWLAWTQGDATQHSRACSFCTVIDRQNHNEITTGAWVNADATNHSRPRSCNVCSRFMRTETQAHGWVNFAGGNSASNHRCSTCLREAAHVWPGWGHGDGVNHSRICSTAGCNQQQIGAHAWGNWGGWTQGDANNHHRTGSCTTCGRAAAVGSTAGTFAAHTSRNAWIDIHDGSHCVVDCTTCGRHLQAANHWNHASGWINHDNDAGGHGHCRRQCNLCGRHLQYQAHTYQAGWPHFNMDVHARDCTSCGYRQHVRHNWVCHGVNGWPTGDMHRAHLSGALHTGRCTICNYVTHGHGIMGFNHAWEDHGGPMSHWTWAAGRVSWSIGAASHQMAICVFGCWTVINDTRPCHMVNGRCMGSAGAPGLFFAIRCTRGHQPHCAADVHREQCICVGGFLLELELDEDVLHFESHAELEKKTEFDKENIVTDYELSDSDEITLCQSPHG